MDHRHDRCDSDATRDEQVVGGWVERQIVARGIDGQHVTCAQGLVEVAAAALRCGFELDGDLVAVSIGGVTAQRIAASEAVRQVHGDVGTRRPGGQRRGVERDETDGPDTVGDRTDRGDAHRRRHPCRDAPAEGGRAAPLRGHRAHHLSHDRRERGRDDQRGGQRDVPRGAAVGSRQARVQCDERDDGVARVVQALPQSPGKKAHDGGRQPDRHHGVEGEDAECQRERAERRRVRHERRRQIEALRAHVGVHEQRADMDECHHEGDRAEMRVHDP